MPDSSAVPAFIPLSLLEAIRNLDMPVEDGLDELAQEIVARRLGLSGTVLAQIQRYRATAESGGSVPADEAISVIRLVGRRPDARLVFADAGRRSARYAVGRRPGRPGAWASPRSLGGRLAFRNAARVAADAFQGDLKYRGAATEVRMARPLSIAALPDGGACAFYSAAYAELLRVVTGFEGAMLHEHCQSRGDDLCHWRAAGGGYE